MVKSKLFVMNAATGHTGECSPTCNHSRPATNARHRGECFPRCGCEPATNVAAPEAPPVLLDERVARHRGECFPGCGCSTEPATNVSGVPEPPAILTVGSHWVDDGTRWRKVLDN